MTKTRLVQQLLGCLLFALAANTFALDLTPGHHYRDLVAEFQYEINALDTTADPTEIRSRVDDTFSALDRQQIDFGFTTRTIWLFLPLENRSPQASQWILSLNTRFMNELVVHIKTEGKWRLLLDNSSRSHFHERPLDYRLLSMEFEVEALSEAELLIGYKSRGTTYLPVSIETVQSFADARAIANTKSGGFYTAAMLMLLYGLFQLLLPGNRIYLHYVAYLAAAMLYVFHMDGLSFQYLWPGLPRWNAFASLPLGLLINIFAASFSRHFLETWRTAPRFNAAILAMIALSLAAIVFGLLVEDLYIKRASFWLTSAGTLLYLAAGVNALLQGRRSARFYVAGWVGISCAAILSSFIHSLPGALPVSLSFDVTKAGILFDALMFGMAMADRANQVRQQRDEALQREMQAIKAQTQARSALAAAKQGRADALRIAQQKNLQLASASHDIRQPLSSLKMALSAMAKQGTESSGDTSKSALDSVEYLDALVSGYLDSAREEQLSDPHLQRTLNEQESFPIQVILDGAVQMFSGDAAVGGIKLVCSSSSMQVLGDPVATMRIASNLLKNAITHTNNDAVLLGCRRRMGICELWVADKGPGLSLADQKNIFAPFQQGQDSQEGHGLGLPIVASLCEKFGYTLAVASVLGKGTVMKIGIPRAGN